MIDANNLTLTQAILLGLFWVVCIFLMVGAFHFYTKQAMLVTVCTGLVTIAYAIERNLE